MIVPLRSVVICDVSMGYLRASFVMVVGAETSYLHTSSTYEPWYKTT